MASKMNLYAVNLFIVGSLLRSHHGRGGDTPSGSRECFADPIEQGQQTAGYHQSGEREEADDPDAVVERRGARVGALRAAVKHPVAHAVLPHGRCRLHFKVAAWQPRYEDI